MPVKCVQMKSSIIYVFWFYPCLSCYVWVCLICIRHEIVRLHDWGWKHVLLSFSIWVNIENIYFLPWVSWMGLNPSNKLESVSIFWRHCDIPLSVLHATLWIQVYSSPVRCKILLFTEWWIGNAWFSRWCESGSCDICSWNLDASLKICVITDSWNVSPIVDCLESMSFAPSKSSVFQRPSGSVPSRCIPCFCKTSLIVGAVLPQFTCRHILKPLGLNRIFNQYSCD
jgi:hypothetical protein